MKSYGTAIALAFFLGGFGLHKFYLNKPFMGILYVLFCWTFIPAIISIFDALALMALGKSMFDRKYNKLFIDQKQKTI